MSKTRKSQPMTLKPQQNQSQLSLSASAILDIDASADRFHRFGAPQVPHGGLHRWPHACRGLAIPRDPRFGRPCDPIAIATDSIRA